MSPVDLLVRWLRHGRNRLVAGSRVLHECPECGEMKVPIADWHRLILTCPDCRNLIPFWEKK